MLFWGIVIVFIVVIVLLNWVINSILGFIIYCRVVFFVMLIWCLMVLISWVGKVVDDLVFFRIFFIIIILVRVLFISKLLCWWCVLIICLKFFWYVLRCLCICVSIKLLFFVFSDIWDWDSVFNFLLMVVMSCLKWVIVDWLVFFLKMSILCCKFSMFFFNFLIKLIFIMVVLVVVIFLIKVVWFFLVI